MKIGIVGSGIAGLAAGWMLDRAGHEVDLFERLSAPGMAAHGLRLAYNDNTIAGDVPSRMFNRWQWPRLCELYRQLGVDVTTVNASQTFQLIGQKPYLKLANAQQPRCNLSLLLRSKPRRILMEARRLRKYGQQDLDRGMDTSVSMRQYLTEGHYSREFTEQFLYPTLSSTVCTCSFDRLDQYPAFILLEALSRLTKPNSALHRTRWGTADVVSRLTSGSMNMHLGCNVDSVHRFDSTVVLHANHGNGESARFEFDHLLLAVQANHIAAIVRDLTPDELSMLGQFHYESVQVVVHRDRSLMPCRPSDWSTFNMSTQGRRSACTVWMNQFHQDWEHPDPVFQTISPVIDPASDLVNQSVSLQRPVVDQATRQGWQRIQDAHSEPGRNLWFAGSYASPGVPLLESAVVSVLSILDRLQVQTHVGSADSVA